MKKHFWQGELISDQELKARVDDLSSHILRGHSLIFNLDEFYRSCDRFRKRLLTEENLRKLLCAILVDSGECNQPDAEVALREIAEFIEEKALRSKLNTEFGTDNPFRSQRVLKGRPAFESWVPLGFLVQILASNSPSLAVLSAFEGLLTGNINFVKLSKKSSDFTMRFFEEFFKDPICHLWKELLIVAKVSSSEKELLLKVMSEADGVVAWGGEESLSEIRKITPTRARLIEWGHRISFAYVTQKKLADINIYNQIAVDVFLFDQQSCSSPQCLFIEDATFAQMKNFAVKLAEAFDRRMKTEKINLPDDLESAEITRTLLVAKTEGSLKSDFSEVIEEKNKQWRIVLDSREGLRASPLYRTLWIKPMKRDHILKILRPLGEYLQTVGLSCDREELHELQHHLYKAGVTRIRPLGKMVDSYAGEPHDGVSALTRYMKKVSLEQECGIDQFATLDDLRMNKINLVNLPERVMTKEDFQMMNPPEDVKELFFKSGGSSGEPKISVFTYIDYHRQMKFAADGFMAAGLNPATDRCMNLYFSGGLYGSFISHFSALEDIEVVQLPMTAHMDFDFVIDMIIKNKVNVLMGMPSYLMQLIEAKSDLFKKHKLIKKIFFGGEAFTKKQIERLKSEFGISSIVSATYGSVDMGPLGYQCAESPIGIHHLHQTLHSLEILDLEHDRPVPKGEPGRLVFTSYGRQGLSLLRYDIGDLGAWVTEPCSCGRLSPRFELLGRHGDIFRIGGNFLNYNKFLQILSNEFSYSFEAQLILLKNENKDEINVIIDQSSQLDESSVREQLIQNYVELKELVLLEKSTVIRVQSVNQENFLRSDASGKLKRIVDQREK